MANLGDAKFITTLDIKSAYHHIPIKESDRHKTAFSALHYHLEYNRSAFGLKNSAIYFNQLMSKILSKIKGTYVCNYADDIIVFSRTFEEHLQHLKEVFTRFRNANIKLNLSKCKFVQSSVEYLGHSIDKDGLRPSTDKVEAVQKHSSP